MAPTLREATLDDLDTITDISVASMSPTPMWSWRFPHREQYPTEHRSRNYNLYKRVLSDTTGCWRIFLAVEDATGTSTPTTPTSPLASPGTVMGFAVWSLVPLLMGDEQIASYESPYYMDIDLPDTNPARVKALSAATARLATDVFEAKYGKHGYFMMRIVAVHPDHWKRGVGEVLVRWGIGFAAGMIAVDRDRARQVGQEEDDDRKKNTPAIGVIAATNEGGRLYRKLGFKEHERIPVKTDEEGDEGVELVAMSWEPNPELFKEIEKARKAMEEETSQ